MATIGCAECKKRLTAKINEYMIPIREKRSELEKQPDYLKDIIYEGSKKAQQKAKETIDKVEQAVKMYK